MMYRHIPVLRTEAEELDRIPCAHLSKRADVAACGLGHTLRHSWQGHGHVWEDLLLLPRSESPTAREAKVGRVRLDTQTR